MPVVFSEHARKRVKEMGLDQESIARMLTAPGGAIFPSKEAKDTFIRLHDGWKDLWVPFAYVGRDRQIMKVITVAWRDRDGYYSGTRQEHPNYKQPAAERENEEEMTTAPALAAVADEPGNDRMFEDVQLLIEGSFKIEGDQMLYWQAQRYKKRGDVATYRVIATWRGHTERTEFESNINSGPLRIQMKILEWLNNGADPEKVLRCWSDFEATKRSRGL